jgi:serine protease Do
MRKIVFQLIFKLLLLIASINITYASLVKVIPKIQPSVLAIGTFNPGDTDVQKIGTGFVVGDGTIVATNYHIIKNPQTYIATQLINNDKKIYGVKLIAKDLKHDLALLKLQDAKLKPLNLSTCNCVIPGESYAFMGYPQENMLDLYPITHGALISAVGLSKFPTSTALNLVPENLHVYQLQANVYPGNSGSPLFNQNTGEVVAVIYKFLSRGMPANVMINNSGIGYAMPIKYINKMLAKLK